MCGENDYTEYVAATDEEKAIVSSDSEVLAQLRYFLCSASWKLSGHYDEAGNFEDRSPQRVYTFLPAGQIVMREDGKNIPGYYTLNNGFADLDYVLEDGQAHYTPLYVENSSSYCSTIFLYPEYMNNASDLY